MNSIIPQLNLENIVLRMNEAVNILNKSFENNKISGNTVIIFDIDDTLIDSYTGQILWPVYNFYNYIKHLGIIPILITARSACLESINYTLNQLKYLGINGYQKIYFRPEDKIDLYSFKANSRKSLLDTGFQILMSIGDMPWDIGEYGGYGILLR
jgi:predicted secreted acid phosphatase